MRIEFVKTTGVTLFGETVWDGYTAVVDGKDYKQIKKVRGEWLLSKEGSSVALTFKTLREAKAQVKKELERLDSKNKSLAGQSVPALGAMLRFGS